MTMEKKSSSNIKMSAAKKANIRRMKVLLQKRERQLVPLSHHCKKDLLAKGMELTPGLAMPGTLQETNQKIMHIIYHHFRVSNEDAASTATRRGALEITRKLLHMVDKALEDKRVADAAAKRQKASDQASSESGKENLVSATTCTAPRPHNHHHASSSRNGNQTIAPSLPTKPSQKHQRASSMTQGKFSLSNFCQAKDAYGETTAAGVHKNKNIAKNGTTPGFQQPPRPMHQPPPYQKKSPALEDSAMVVDHQEAHHKKKKRDEKRKRDEAKRLEEEQRKTEEAAKRILEEQRKREEQQKRAEEQRKKKQEEERKRQQQAEQQKREEERKRLAEQQRIEAERKKEEEERRRQQEEQKRQEEQRKRETERKRIEEQKRMEEEKLFRKREEERKRVEAQHKKEQEFERKRRQAQQKLEGEIRDVMDASRVPRGQEIRVVFPADSKPTKACSLHERRELAVRYKPRQLDRAQAENMATRLARWDPYWKVHKYVKCGITSVAKDASNGSPKWAANVNFCMMPRDIGGLMNKSDWGSNVCDGYQNGQMRLIFRMIPVIPTYKNRADCHLWPKGTYCNLNGFALSLEQRKQQSHDEKKWQGLCKHLDLTAHIRQPTQTSHLKILTVEQEPYFFCIALCQYQAPATLITNYINANPALSDFEKLSREESMAKAKSFTKQALSIDDSDDDDAAGGQDEGKFIFTVTCPFSKTIMKKPVRGKQCKHYQCFDLSNFMEGNNSVNGNRWRCLVCEQYLSYYDLQSDRLVEDLISEFRNELVPTDRDRIEYYANGTYKLLGTRKSRYNNKKRGASSVPDVASSAHAAKKAAKAPVNVEPEIILLDDD